MATKKPKTTKKTEPNYKKKYDPTMCETLIALFADGGSRAHFCAKHHISYKTFDNWRKRYPEFQEAYEIGIPKAEMWWQDIAQDHIVHKFEDFQLNSVAWSMNMRNRFGWTEHRLIDMPGMVEAKTFNDKFNILTKHIEDGKYTGTEIAAITGLLTAGIKIAESAELLERLDKLEGLLEDKKEDEAIG